MGFDGKHCIHPAQLPIVNEIFSPTEQEVRRAKAIMEAYQAAVSEGRGAISLDGKMIDNASLRVAEIMLQKDRAIREK